MPAKLPPSLDHASLVRTLRARARGVDPKRLGGAFVASLIEPPGFWRAPLMAMAIARAVPAHVHRGTRASCVECGLEQRNRLEPLHARGQLLPDELAGALVALDQARGQVEPRPSKPAIAAFRQLLTVVGELPGAAREGKLNDAIRAARLIRGDRYDIRHIIETLGACSVLETPEHPGFHTRWTSHAARQHRPGRVECDPPIAFWSAAHGVNAEAVKFWFGDLKIAVPRASRPRPAEVAKKSEGVSKSDARAARVTEFVVGDAVAVPVGARWVAAVAIALNRDRGGTWPIWELRAWTGDAPPSLAEVRRARAVGGPFSMHIFKRADPRKRWQHVGGGLKPTLRAASGYRISDVDEIAGIAREHGVL